MRKCSVCGKEMESGWVIHDGLRYACSLTCLHSLVTPEEYSELYENGEAYYTEWDDEEEEINLYEEPKGSVSCTINFYKKITNPTYLVGSHIITQDRIKDTPKNIIRYLNMTCEENGFVGYNITIRNVIEFSELKLHESRHVNHTTKPYVIKTVREHDFQEIYTEMSYLYLLEVLNNTKYPMTIIEIDPFLMPL